MKTIVAFDFDGTLTTKNSLFIFLFYIFGYKKVLLGVFVNSISIVKMFLKVKSAHKTKEDFLSFFIKGLTKKKITRMSSEFCKDKLPLIIRKEAYDKMLWHKTKNHEIVIISASPEDWILPWANLNNVKVIGTKLLVKNNLITGRFSSKNCIKEEKVNRLLEMFPNKEFYYLYAYGDSRGDLELLNFADKSFYKSF